MNKLMKEKLNQKNHLMKSSWNLGKTATMRVPTVLKSELMDLARHIDNGGKIKLINSTDSELREKAKTILSQDTIADVISILEHSITSKKKGGVYNSSNASPTKQEVIKALSILKRGISNV